MKNYDRNPFKQMDVNTYSFNEYRDVNQQYPVNEDVRVPADNKMQYPYDEDMHNQYPIGNDMYTYYLDKDVESIYPGYADLYGRYFNNLRQDQMNNDNGISSPYNEMYPPYRGMHNRYPGYLINDYTKNNSCYCIKSYLRILNALVDGPPLDVYVNEMQIASNLKFGEFSRHVLYTPGNYRVVAYPSGTTNTPILVTDIVIHRNLTYTGVIAGETSDPNEISLFMIPEEKENADMNRMAALRLVNLAIDTPPLDLILDDETILFYGLEYGDVSNNVAIPADNYTMHLRESNGNTEILTAPGVDLAPKMHYTLFVIGRYGDSPRIELIIPDDGVNYLDIC